MVKISSSRRPSARLLVASFILMLGAAAASAAVPGQNGRIAFQTDVSGSSQVAVVDNDGFGFRQLTLPPGTSGTPAWSPDGRKIAFSSDRLGEARIFVMDFATGAVTPLTTGTGFFDSTPRWAPSGLVVGFTRCIATPADCDVWTINADGTNPVDLTPDPNVIDQEPAFSPDGLKIAFVSSRDGDSEIYTMNTDGTLPTRLTIAPEEDHGPDWSPDGLHIAFARTDATGASMIWTMDPAGANQLALGPGEQPAWSPDGTLIAFVFVSSGNRDLYTMNTSGTQTAPVVASLAQESWPAWQAVNPGTNVPPVANAGLDGTVECDTLGGANVVLDGTGSTDADSTPGTNDDIVLYEWWENFGTVTEAFLGTGATLPVTLPLGSHVITLQATDSTGQMSTDDILITVVDTTPPSITVALTPNRIWPPNHKMVKVHAIVTATDVCSMPVVVVLDSVTSNEPDLMKGSGNTVNDIQGADIGTEDYWFWLRAERAGGGCGRVYTATYTATDAGGLAATASATAVVPHDMGKGKHNRCGPGDDQGGKGKNGDKGKGGKSGKGNGNGNGNGGGKGHGK